MQFRFRCVSVTVRFSFLAILALFLLFDENQIGLQVLLAVVIHESGHLLTALLFHSPISGIEFSCVGIEIRKRASGGEKLWQEIVIYLAGPLFNFFAAVIYGLCSPAFGFLCKVMTAVHLVMGIFQLLPIEILDGGMILRLCLEASRFSDQSNEILLVVSFLTLLLLSVLIFWSMGSGMGNLSMIITVGYLVFQLLKTVRKACNRRKKRETGI